MGAANNDIPPVSLQWPASGTSPSQAYRRVIANFQSKLDASKAPKIDAKPQTAARALQTKPSTPQINNFLSRRGRVRKNEIVARFRRAQKIAPILTRDAAVLHRR